MAITKVSNDLLATPATSYDDSGVQDDIAILGFKVASNGSLAKYNLVDQTIDDFIDSSGIDTSTSSDARRMSGGYYKGSVSGNGTGGTITSYSAGGVTYKVHTLADGDSFVAPASGTIDFLIVGGGAGGWYGGGGAGGVVYGSSQSITAASYSATVGSGGSSTNNGNDSTWNSFTAKGGGAGGNYTSGAITATTGGSGGGGGMGNPIGGIGGGTNQDTYSGTTNVTGYGTDNSGYRGGGYTPPNDDGAQGGAGAGGTVEWVPASHSAGEYNWDSKAGGGGGGVGKEFDITGTATYYGGGGGGARGDNSVGGVGGLGGGGQGGITSAAAGTAGTAGLGGGGGGGQAGTGGAGGSGTVIIRYIENDFVTTAQADMTLVSASTTSTSTPTTGDIVMTVFAGIGSFSKNVDIKAYISRDNGSNWTQATLVNEGSTGSHTILSAHNVDISSQPSGTSLRYKVTTHNQSASKETRVYAISLGWS